MSVFGSIMSAIFGKAPGAAAAAPGAKPATPAGGGSAATAVDVEAILTKMEDEGDEDSNWRQSIVDLMKLLNLDCSLTARKALAKELGYTGALDGSAEMNIWLHQQVMREARRERAAPCRTRSSSISRSISALVSAYFRVPPQARCRRHRPLPLREGAARRRCGR